MNLQKIPMGVWSFGLVSLLMGMSLGMIHSLLPTFMVTVLGASLVSVGIIEGVTEGLSLLVKIVAGTVSDLTAKRKVWIMLGYGLAAFTKPLYPLATNLYWLFLGRIIDRIGRGLRGAPRDALISEIVSEDLRGTCFGLRQALGRIGVLLGPLLAIFFLYTCHENIRLVLWLAVIPSILAVFIAAFFVTEPEPKLKHTIKKTSVYAYLNAIQQLDRPFWFFLLFGNLILLIRFNEAFVILKAQRDGMSLAIAPITFACINACYALSAFPSGALSDSIGRRKVLIMGVLFLSLGGMLLTFSSSLYVTLLGAACWGLHLGFCQGLLDALIADNTPANLRGFGYGIFNFFAGITTFLSSFLAGIISMVWGMKILFLLSSILGCIVVCWLILENWRFSAFSYESR